MRVTFDVAYLYYLPHYDPVISSLISKGVDVSVVFYDSPPTAISEQLTSKNVSVNVINDKDSLSFYKQQMPDWVIFGHANELATELNSFCKTALILHGLGPKSTYYNASSSDIQHRFVESENRTTTLQLMFSDKSFITTGYSKLDPLVTGDIQSFDLVKLGLDPNKKTILYSPTFYPSTIENFPKNWPEDFSDYNILIKPHFISLTNSTYKKQRVLFNQWQSYPNVYFAQPHEQSLLPFMATADVMISETSSAMFEFMALNKPVIVCTFLKLRWGYRGILKFRLNKRLSDDYDIFKSIGPNVSRYRDLRANIDRCFDESDPFQTERKKHTQQIVGIMDGKASERITSFLLTHTGK